MTSNQRTKLAGMGHLIVCQSDNQCHECKTEIRKGDDSVWVRSTLEGPAALYCMTCGKSMLPAEKGGLAARSNE